MTNPHKPASSHSPKNGLFRYQLLLLVLLPILFFYTLYMSVKYRSIRYLLQRFGIFHPSQRVADIWIHAASVGEVNAALLLIRSLRKRYPQHSILLTTVTPTGAALFAQQHLDNTSHLYLPIDYPRLILSLIQQCKPKCLLLMETEIWPNLFRVCHQNNIPLCTVNGRISNKTMNTTGWIRSLYKSTLQCATMILTRSDNDTKAYIALGADGSKVKTIGNIKFSIDVHTTKQEKQNRIIINRPYILVASTHDNEEFLISKLWKQQKVNQLINNTLLIIAPRHPSRINDILAQLKNLQMNLAVRSRQDEITNSTDVYIADTVGELVDFMTDALMVFVGGSLVPVGGHNVIEPAALGKPIVFGPHMGNFADEAELLVSLNAAIQVANVEQLADKFVNVIRDPEYYSKMGMQAKQLIDQHKDTADRYVEALGKYLSQL